MAGHATQPLIDYGIDCWGDSLTEATSGSVAPADGWPQRLGYRFYPRRVSSNWGVGGQTSSQILARQIVYPCTKTQVFWAGRNDPVNSIDQAGTLANIAAMVAHTPHSRFVVLSVINKTDGTEDVGSAARTAILSLNAALLAAYPSNYLDVLTSLDNDTYRQPADHLHLTVAGQRVVESAVYGFLSAKGW